MRRIINFLIVACLIFIYGCMQTSGKAPAIINIDYAFDHVGKMNLSEVADSVYYVHLVTPDSIILNNSIKYERSGSYLFVLDQVVNAIYKFDLTGKYVKTLTSNGEGPGEVKKIVDFTVDDSNLYVLDPSLKKVQIINYLQDTLLREFTTETQPISIKKISDRLLLFIPTKGKGIDELPHLMTYDLTGKVMNKLRLDETNEQNRLSRSTIQKWGKDNVIFWVEGQNKVFETSDSLDIKVRYTIESTVLSDAKALFSDNTSPSYYNKIVLIDDIIETKDFIFISAVKDRHHKTIAYNKKDKTCKNVEFNLNFIDHAFINDIDGGIPFWPSKIMDNGEMSAYFPAFRFKAIWASDQLGSTQPFNNKRLPADNKLFSSLPDESNPVLMFVKPKT